MRWVRYGSNDTNNDNNIKFHTYDGSSRSRSLRRRRRRSRSNRFRAHCTARTVWRARRDHAADAADARNVFRRPTRISLGFFFSTLLAYAIFISNHEIPPQPPPSPLPIARGIRCK